MSSPIFIAVLIDAENVAPAYADALFDAAKKLGTVTLQRAYGDFGGPAAGWREALAKHAIMPIHVSPERPGKNVADLALAIDAVELFHARLFDLFCIASSDSDFTRLALRLREMGVQVHGFGERKTLGSFRAACDSFHVLEAAAPPAPTVLTTQPLLTFAPTIAKPAPPGLRAASCAMPFIEKALAASRTDCEGWVDLATLGTHLSRDPTFKLRDFGFSQLGKLVAELKGLETRKPGNGADLVRRRRAG